jgi:hypothetical protein
MCIVRQLSQLQAHKLAKCGQHFDTKCATFLDKDNALVGSENVLISVTVTFPPYTVL